MAAATAAVPLRAGSATRANAQASASAPTKGVAALASPVEAALVQSGGRGQQSVRGMAPQPVSLFHRCCCVINLLCSSWAGIKRLLLDTLLRRVRTHAHCHCCTFPLIHLHLTRTLAFIRCAAGFCSDEQPLPEQATLRWGGREQWRSGGERGQRRDEQHPRRAVHRDRIPHCWVSQSVSQSVSNFARLMADH